MYMATILGAFLAIVKGVYLEGLNQLHGYISGRALVANPFCGGFRRRFSVSL
jgi:hypothetical protein